jgi:hypothetical protein
MIIIARRALAMSALLPFIALISNYYLWENAQAWLAARPNSDRRPHGLPFVRKKAINYTMPVIFLFM